MKKLIGDISVISVIYTLAYCFQVYVLVPFNSHERASVFFAPAAVRLMCTLIYGYRACFGITFGTLAFYHLFDDTGLDDEIEFFLVASHSGLACGLALMVWAMLSPKIDGIRDPKVAFKSINALDVFQFSILQATIDTIITHTLFWLNPNIMPEESIYWVLVTFIGDLTGAYLVFIMLNLCYSLGKRMVFAYHDFHHRY
jgi:hypothetical protein